MKVSRWTAASAVFAALMAFSLYGCYSFMRMPSTRSRNHVDLQYTQGAEYGYTALLKPSLLYDNRTEVSEGEPLYTKLVERLNVTLSYELTQEPAGMADVVLEYGATACLKGGDWSKTYPLKPRTAVNSSFADTYTVDVEEIEGIVETIGEETGTRAYSYTYEIRPRISLEASVGGEPVEQEFTPTLTIKFEGGKIGFEGLSSSKSGSVTHRETEAATWRLLGYPAEVMDMRVISLIASMPLALLLYIFIGHVLQERASRSFMERLSGDVRDKIIEASEPPERIERATVKVGSLEDLARVSEEAFKPIIHHGDVFYVLDGDIRYEFKMEVEADVEEEQHDQARGL